jgi:3-oxoacyl-[acyl-carrier protein] reductase
MAVEWGRYGVLANALCPTIIETDMADGLGSLRRPPESIPVGRYGRPREVADVVAFLAGDGAGFVSGTAIPLDGGLMASAQTPIQGTSTA